MADGQNNKPKDMKATERLRQYWERGGGAAKIRWGQPGDFDRCVRQLMQHAQMSKDNAEGYCYERHVGALGFSPQKHAQMEGKGKGKGKPGPGR